MNQKITFPELVNAISDSTGYSKHLSEEFLKELFSLIATTLAAGENVKIKKLGTFKVVDVEARKSIKVGTGEEIEIPGHKKVSFSPDKEIAEAINLPFAAFETIELNDNVTDDMLESADIETSLNTTASDNTKEIAPPLPLTEWVAEDDDNVSEAYSAETNEDSNAKENIEYSTDEVNIIEGNDHQSQQDSNIESNEEIIYTSNLNDIQDYNDIDESEDILNINTHSSDSEALTHSPVNPNDSTLNTESNLETSNDIDDETDNKTTEIINTKNPKKKGFLPGFIWGMVATIAIFAVGIATVHFVAPHLIQSPSNPNDASTIASASSANTTSTTKIDTIETIVNKESILPATKPSDAVVYDTISLTRFLTTMAREHYGNYHLWSYIYEENSQILGHPDRIKPGTRVVIPPKSKYNIDPNNPECIKIAKRKGVEIYKQYKNNLNNKEK